MTAGVAARQQPRGQRIRPLIFVDVDGVLIPFQARSVGTRGPGSDGVGNPLRYDPSLPLAFTIADVFGQTFEEIFLPDLAADDPAGRRPQ